MPEMPSNFNGEANFLAQYIPSLSRSGVLLNPTFPILEPERDFRMPNPHKTLMDLHDNMESNAVSEDSLEDEEYNAYKEALGRIDRTDKMTGFQFNMKKEMFIQDPDCHWEDNQIHPAEDLAVREGLNDPLLKKLEQLRELQQQKQEQLKQQQMEQLQKLMEEQKMLLNMVYRGPAYIGCNKGALPPNMEEGAGGPAASPAGLRAFGKNTVQHCRCPVPVGDSDRAVHSSEVLVRNFPPPNPGANSGLPLSGVSGDGYVGPQGNGYGSLLQAYPELLWWTGVERAPFTLTLAEGREYRDATHLHMLGPNPICWITCNRNVQSSLSKAFSVSVDRQRAFVPVNCDLKIKLRALWVQSLDSRPGTKPAWSGWIKAGSKRLIPLRISSLSWKSEIRQITSLGGVGGGPFGRRALCARSIWIGVSLGRPKRSLKTRVTSFAESSTSCPMASGRPRTLILLRRPRLSKSSIRRCLWSTASKSARSVPIASATVCLISVRSVLKSVFHGAEEKMLIVSAEAGGSGATWACVVGSSESKELAGDCKDVEVRFCELDPQNSPSDPAAARAHRFHSTPPVSHHAPINDMYGQYDLANDNMTNYFKDGSNAAPDQEGADDFLNNQENRDFNGDSDSCDESREKSTNDLQCEQKHLLQQLSDSGGEASYTEERPIVSEIKERKKSFEEFLEEQMRLEEQRLKQNDNLTSETIDKPVAKRPFLRRGEGLTRFRNASSKLAKRQDNEPRAPLKASEATNVTKVEKVQRKTTAVCKEQISEKIFGESKKSHQNGRGKTELLQKKSVLTNHNAKNSTPSTVLQPENTSSWNVNNAIRREKIGILEPNKENVSPTAPQQIKGTNSRNQMPSTTTNARTTAKAEHRELSFEVSFQKRHVNWEKTKQNENFELEEFLLLEQAAEDISFSSNSSFVQKLLDQNYHIENSHGRLSSTPVKQPDKIAGHGKDSNMVKLDPAGKKNEMSGALKNKNCSSVPLPVEEEKISAEILKTASKELKTTRFNEQARQEDQCLASDDLPAENEDRSDYHGDFEGYPEKGDDARDLELELSDREDGDESTLLDNKSNSNSQDDSSSLSSSSNSSQIEFDDERTWADLEDLGNPQGFGENKFVSKEFVPSAYTTKSPVCASDKTIKRKVASKKVDDLQQTNSNGGIQSPPPTSDLMMKLFPSLKPPKKPEPQLTSKQTSVQEDAGDLIRSQLLREKLIELENEVERFKMENASLARLREDQEKTMESLRKDVADFEQQKAKELTQIEDLKKEALKKLQKDRKVFEKYASAARAIPDKKEREEIQSLKQHVKDLQEELKRKEARWSTTHGRLRDQIETLLKENAELREEIKFMEKVRVESWKKTEAAESKRKNVENRRQSDSANPVNATDKPKSPSSVSLPEKHTHVTSRSQSPNKAKVLKQCKLPTVSHVTESETTKCSDHMPQTEQKLLTPVLKGSEDEDVQGEICYSDGKIERILRNGCHVILFPNGTRKEVSSDGNSTTVTFFNGDVKQVMADQRVIYYYADAKTTHTTYPDGLEVLQFSNGQIEKHFPDGKKEITFPDQTIKNLNTDGTEESIFTDGTIITIQPDGSKIIAFDNGQRELHTAQFKRREYPDGTVKTVYNNGQQETKYASGRVRVKDKDGNVLMDTK
ncbi:centrosomal P4.1-associated protein [Pelodytes ibericus]